jgi:hypothetical protein
VAGSGAADEFSVDPFTRTYGSEPSSATSAGHLPSRSVGHDMAYKIADIALHFVHEVVK